MKVLLCHNYYQQPGGEDRSFFDEEWLLKSHGHQVVRYTVHNDVIDDMSSVQLAKKLIWNRDAYREVRKLIQRERPAIMHCTNTFPLISPSVYYAAKREGGILKSRPTPYFLASSFFSILPLPLHFSQLLPALAASVFR